LRPISARRAAPSRTYGNLFFFRTFLKDGDPKPGVESVKKLLRVYPLAEADHPPEMNFVNISGKAFNTIGPSDYSFWDAINQVIQHEPSDAMDPFTLGFLASIGIEKGKPFAPDERMKAILKEAAAVGDATARTLAYKCRIKEAYFYPNSAWFTPFVSNSYKFGVNGARLLDAYSFSFFYATGITPAMTEKMVGEGSQYAVAFVDANDDPLDGGKPTSCTCRPTSRPRISGPCCSTTIRPACSRPTSNIRVSVARQRDCKLTTISRSISGSARRLRVAMRTIGCRPLPAKAGTSSCAFTDRLSRGSTKPGGLGGVRGGEVRHRATTEMPWPIRLLVSVPLGRLSPLLLRRASHP